MRATGAGGAAGERRQVHVVVALRPEEPPGGRAGVHEAVAFEQEYRVPLDRCLRAGRGAALQKQGYGSRSQHREQSRPDHVQQVQPCPILAFELT